MAYDINKTDGSLLVTILDSAIDKSATDITLIGKNVTGYGEYINENFVKLLENFASTSEPNNPITGQLWFDIAENRLKVYDGNTFRIGAGPIVQSTPPLDPQQGDFWIDTQEGRLYFYDGITGAQPASKAYNNTQGVSGFIIASIKDSAGNTKTITRLHNGGKLLGVFSSHPEFTPQSSISSDFIGTVKPGFNPSTLSDFKFHTRAASADALANPAGELLTTDDLVQIDNPNTLTDVLTIMVDAVKQPAGLQAVLGPSGEVEVKVSPSEYSLSTTRISQDFKLFVHPIGATDPAIFVKASSNTVGIFNNNPDSNYTLDVNGDVKIVGDLLVEGSTTTISTTNLEIEDKLIDLGKVVTPTDLTADGGGIRLLGTTNHTIIWNNLYDSWNLSEHVNLPFGKEYRINNVRVIDELSLGTSITSSNLTSVGTLLTLNVSTGSLITNITDNVISSQGSLANVDLILNPKGTGTVNVSNSNISNVLDPRPGAGFEKDAANRGYVDATFGSPWQSKTINYSMSIQDKILADTSAGSIRLVLPNTDSLSLGQIVRIADLRGTFDTQPLQLVRYRKIDPTYVGTSAGAGVYTSAVISATGVVAAPSMTIVSPGVVSYTATLTGLTSTVDLAEGVEIFATSGTGSLYTGAALSCRVLSVVNLNTITYKVVGNSVSLSAPTVGNISNVTINGIPTTTSGSGTGLTVGVEITGPAGAYTPSNTTITVLNHGFGYTNGNTITVSGAFLGGTSPANDLTLTIIQSNISSVDADLLVNDPDASFGLYYAGFANGWKYSENAVLPPLLVADLQGDLIGDVRSSATSLVVLNTSGITATFSGDVTGNLSGNVTGNITGSVLTAAQPSITSLGTLTSLSVSGTITGNVSGNLTGNVTGNISNTTLNVNGTNTLNLTSGTGSIVLRSGSNGFILSGFDNTNTQNQYAMQLTPATNASLRPTVNLFGDVVVNNVTSANINGSSFRLPQYTAVQLAARTLTLLNRGELIYNTTAKKIQAYVEDGGGVGVDGWVDLH